MRSFLIVFFLSCQLATIFSQSANNTFFQGFSEEVSGKRFGYHSPLPTVSESLLLRGRQDFEAISWSTEVMPEQINSAYINLIWIFGMDVHSDPVKFDLWLNGEEILAFQNSKSSSIGEKKFKGKEGTILTLNTTMLDKYEDQMGFAILKIPSRLIKKGLKNLIAISTKTQGNNAWFMTFRSPIFENITAYQNKVVVKENGQLFHSISFDFIHIGSEENAVVKFLSQEKSIQLNAGFNKLELNVPMVQDSSNYTANIKIGSQAPIEKSVAMAPVREWQIYLVQHTHTDIGYTRPQTEILAEHLKYIDYALDFCDRTDNYPDAAKFRWTCETSWSIREYLKSRPRKQIDRLLQRIREGRIEATGMFLNYSEIMDESALATQTKTLKMLKNQGIDVTTAMQNDVNGIAWCLVDYFSQTDVKYVTMGIHAHRARKPFEIPTSFWWESPAGNRLLAFRSEHYQHGNSLSLTTGQQDVFRNNLSDYLAGLEAKSYPYDRIALQFSGYVTDNSPPSAKVCDIIRDWNEKYEWPKLKSALASEFMVYLDEKHGEELPTHKLAWPDWWTDGVASAANETKMSRLTQIQMNTISAILSMTRLLAFPLPKGHLEETEAIYDQLLFYNEHTHGAAESITEPLSQNTINQWNMKSAYVWEAAKKAHLLEEKALAFIQAALPPDEVPTITVFNTLNWGRSGFLKLFIQHEVIPSGTEFSILDEKGREVPSQRYEERMEGAYFGLWLENIPPFGFKTYSINPKIINDKRDESGQPGFENQYYKIDFCNQKGIIKQIYDKDLKINLLDKNDSLSLGQMIYEQLDNRHQLERLTNTTRDTIYKALKGKRTLLSDIKELKRMSGSIYNSIVFHGNLPGCVDEKGVEIEIRLYHFKKKIEFHYKMSKLPVIDPESVYVAFPFQLENANLQFEAQGGLVRPGKDQLEGTSSDWNTIQNFASVRNEENQIVFVSNEIPLVQFGAINTGRYYYKLHPATNHIFSWVLNNYWVTNFKASQGGELRWSYSICSSDDNSTEFATKFGMEERTPLLSRIQLANSPMNDSSKLFEKSALNLDFPGLILINARPSMDDKGIILHLREVEGGHISLSKEKIQQETGASEIMEVSILEEKIQNLQDKIKFDHFETKFIKLIFDQENIK